MSIIPMQDEEDRANPTHAGDDRAGDARGDAAVPGAFEHALADALLRRATAPSAWLHAVVAALAAAVQQGHSCLPLALLATATGTDPGKEAGFDEGRGAIARLRASGLAGDAGSAAPLILSDGALYLRRYFQYERAVAAALVERALAPVVVLDAAHLASLQATLDTLFGVSAAPVPDWQRIAALLALRCKLTVILGGPGSGKTWTVLRLLALLRQQSATPLRIALAAPTGKAAMRVSQSLQLGLAGLPPALLADLPQAATTVHRLLGMRPHSSVPRYHAASPLPLDVLVLDEASMIDLPNMARILAALPAQAQLILLGDPDQLASVEIGNVLAELRRFNPQNRYSPLVAAMLGEASGHADIASSDRAHSAFGDVVVTLERTRRFAADSAIGQLVQAVRHGDADTACSVLHSGHGLVWHDQTAEQGYTQALHIAGTRYAALAGPVAPEQALAVLGGFRILGGLREGPFGTRRLNATLARDRLGLHAWQPLPAHFAGAPLLITENDHALRLYNGDSGVLLADAQGRLRAWFADAQGALRSFAPAQLPAHELSYASTVHKAQGSEYDGVLVVLPPPGHALLTRAWLYTALSRARHELIVLGSEAALREAIERPGLRHSGLARQIGVALGEAGSGAATSA